MKSVCVIASTAAVLLAAGLAPAVAQTTLKAVNAWNPRIPSARDCSSFYKRFNKTSKEIKLKYIGGPEVTPPRQLADAVRRGLFDVGCTSLGYYLGKAPEGDAVLATTKAPWDLRKDGDLKALQDIYAKRLGVHLLAILKEGPGFYIYLTRKPKLRADGLPDLTGFKIRTSPTHRAFLKSLGATAVSIPFRQVYTALERKVIDGTAFPSFALTHLGLHKFLKVRIEPSFLNLTVAILINKRKWDALPPAQKAILTKMAAKQEVGSYKFFQRLVKKERDTLVKANTTFITLKGDAAKKYVGRAHGIAWDRLIKRSPGTGKALKARMYKE